MLKDKRTIIMVGIVIVLCVLVIINAVFGNPSNKIRTDKEKISIYFLNPLTNTLEPETHYIDKGENDLMVKAVLNILYEGPKSSNLSKTFPDSVRYTDARIYTSESTNERLFEIDFPPEYENMTPTEEQFFRASLVWSITELDFIQDVLIYVGETELVKTGGEPIGRLSRSNVFINPVISSAKVDTKKVRLYFYDSVAKKLVAEERVIQVNPDQPTERYIVEQMIAGPTDAALNLSPTMPVETKIKGDVKTEEGICYINLSSDFANKSTSSADMLQLNIYSVVNSLTELDNVKKVQFLIESEKMENFKGSLDLSKPLERNEELILR